MRHHVLVTYDISDPLRLRQVARVCEDFGDRIQLSVFACQLSRGDLAVLRERLKDTIERAEDQVLFLRLGPVAEAGNEPLEVEALGRPVAVLDTRLMVF